jgi:aspartate 1-decarboxylase
MCDDSNEDAEYIRRNSLEAGEEAELANYSPRVVHVDDRNRPTLTKVPMSNVEGRT